uniref:Uncharacterized protein n=1 Tax=Anopheles arabiensis TaxID=7173 RepID=A0A182IH58_ANOAR
MNEFFQSIRSRLFSSSLPIIADSIVFTKTDERQVTLIKSEQESTGLELNDIIFVNNVKQLKIPPAKSNHLVVFIISSLAFNNNKPELLAFLNWKQFPNNFLLVVDYRLFGDLKKIINGTRISDHIVYLEWDHPNGIDTKMAMDIGKQIKAAASKCIRANENNGQTESDCSSSQLNGSNVPSLEEQNKQPQQQMQPSTEHCAVTIETEIP